MLLFSPLDFSRIPGIQRLQGAAYRSGTEGKSRAEGNQVVRCNVDAVPLHVTPKRIKGLMQRGKPAPPQFVNTHILLSNAAQ